MDMKKLLQSSVLALAALSGSNAAFAHGGASGVDLDACRIPVGAHWVHFTAYQPQIAGTTEYCDAIPEVGEATLVFDYDGQGLRKMNVEFEVTKEPEARRVFYKEPEAYPTGTVNFKVNFIEPGQYLGHVTIVSADGQKVDAHVPFKVGVASSGLSTSTLVAGSVVVLALGYVFYLSNAGFKSTVDRLLGKKGQDAA